MMYATRTALRNPMGSPGLEYGDLESLYPLKTYNELKVIRQSNYNILKNLIETGETIFLDADRLEIFVSDSPIKSSIIDLRGTNKSSSKIVTYPFTPSQTKRVFIEPDYGHVHTIQNLTIGAPVKNYLFETYDCILKPNGESNAIQITSEVRGSFWDDLNVGRNIFYNWTFSVQGESKTVDSVDVENNLIFLTTNISDEVASDTAAKFGTPFYEDIPISDYITFGKPWTVAYEYVLGLNGIPVEDSGSDYILNLVNVDFENFFQGLTVSMGNFKLNLSGDCAVRQMAAGLSAFSRSQNNGQKITINGTFLVEECGDDVAGSVTVYQPSGTYGAGGYIHPSVIVKCNGTLHLKNNPAASWRQYSASGYGPDPSDFNYYDKIIEEGSGEYGFLTSNTMPTVIDRAEFNDGILLIRHDTTINGGFLTRIHNQNLDFGLGERSVVLNNVTINLYATLSLYAHVVLNNCIYKLQKFDDVNVVLDPPSETLTVLGGEIQAIGDVGSYSGPGEAASGNRGSSFTYVSKTRNALIQGLAIPQLNFYFLSAASPQEPYDALSRKLTLKNLVVPSRGFVLGSSTSTAGSISNVIETENVEIISTCSNHFGVGFPQPISGKSGSKSVTLLANETYSVYGTRTKVMEVDWLHNEYHTSGEIEFIAALLWDGTTKVCGNCYYGKNIRLVATGGDITLLCFNSSTRPNSNIIGEDVVVPNGGYVDLVIDRQYILKTGTSSASETVATGNGSSKSYKGVISTGIGTIKILEPATITVTAGEVSVEADQNGVLDDPDLVGIVDPFTGLYQLIFTEAVAQGVEVVVAFSYPNTCKGLGAWVIS